MAANFYHVINSATPYNLSTSIGYGVIIALTGLPIGYSVIVALTGLPLGYSVIVALIGPTTWYYIVYNFSLHFRSKARL